MSLHSPHTYERTDADPRSCIWCRTLLEIKSYSPVQLTQKQRATALELLEYIRPYPDHLATCVSRHEQTAEYCDCGYERCRQCYFELKALLEAA